MSNTDGNQQTKFRRKGDLSLFKFREYLPAMLLNNMSTLLLITVDGLVVGNLTGSDALAAVSVFTPLTTIIGVFTSLVACGISTSLSTTMGSNEGAKIKQIKGASFWLMVYMSVLATIIQIPIVWILLKAYRLPDAIYEMTWKYAIGIMIATPMGMISTIGANMLQIAGKMKILAKLTILEGTVNLVLDLLFVGPLHLGSAGAGMGTAGANLVRCTTTLICLLRYTDMLNFRKYKGTFSEHKDILRLGGPDAVSALVYALQNYCMMQILLIGFGENGGVINGVCMFSFSVVNVLITGVLGSIRPLGGLLAGAGDREGLKILTRQGALFMAVMIGVATAVVEIFPKVFYSLYGIGTVPQGGVAAICVFALFFLPYAFSGFFRLFLTNKKDSKYTSRVTIIGNITQPVIAFGLLKILPAPWVYLSLSITAVFMIFLYVRRIKQLYAIDLKEDNLNEAVLYMSVRQKEAVDASREIRKFADEHGIDPKISYRIALCMEEMVAYIESVNEKDIAAQIIVRFRNSGEATFVIMDNGKCISLQNEEEKEKGLSTDNYVLMQRLAKSVEYQYVQDMNYTILKFALEKTAASVNS